jgi:probable O-glycosylation ligase (exosortase A-associated)
MKGLLFTFGLTYGGAIAALIDPFIGLLVYVCFGILKPEAVWPWSVPQANFSRMIAIALLAGWALRGLRGWDLGKGKAVIMALVGYLVWTIVGALRATDQTLAWGFVEQLAKIVIPIVVGSTMIDSIRKLKLLAWVILLSQAYPAFELNMTYLGGYNQLRTEGFAGMDNNSYAISLDTCCGVAIFMFFHTEKRWQRVIAGASLAMMAHAVLLSFSRGGMLGLVVVSTISFVILPKGRKEVVGFLLATCLGICLAGPQVRDRFRTAFSDSEHRDEAASSRLFFWKVCWDTMLENPVFGVGPDHMPMQFGRMGLRVYENGVLVDREAHTLWLQLGAELGFPGVLLLLSFYGIPVVRLWPIARGKKAVADPWLTYLSRMVIASLAGFAVSAQFVSLERLEAPYYIALVGAGVLKLSTDPLLHVGDSGSPGPQHVDEPDEAGFGWVVTVHGSETCM